MSQKEIRHLFGQKLTARQMAEKYLNLYHKVVRDWTHDKLRRRL